MANYIQYGCGMSAPEKWVNFDASPTLRIQKLPLIGKLLVRNKVVFPDAVRYGDITKGLPGIEANSCDGIYCSHILEHLSLNDCRIALQQTHLYLKPGGVFRCVVPDLEFYIRAYTETVQHQKEKAAMNFMESSLLGLPERPKGLKGMIIAAFGNSHHLWMWDRYSLTAELRKAGFSSVRECTFNDSADPHFKLVEHDGRFQEAVALEAIK